MQKWTASPFQSDPFAERAKIKSGCIKAEFESVVEFAAPDYRSRDRAQNHLPPITLFGRKGIQIACECEVGFAHAQCSYHFRPNDPINASAPRALLPTEYCSMGSVSIRRIKLWPWLSPKNTIRSE